MDIKNYQKLLINKARKYQVKQLLEKPKKAGVEEDLVHTFSPIPYEENGIRTKLSQNFFEDEFLADNERSAEWLMAQLNPNESRPDRIILRAITGFDCEDESGGGVC